MDDLVGCLIRRLIWLKPAGTLGIGGPDLGVGRVQPLVREGMRRYCDRSGLEVTELALEWSWRKSVHTLAGLVSISIGRYAWGP